MARKKTTASKHPLESYEHRDKQRVNNSPVGLVTPNYINSFGVPFTDFF